MPISIQDLPAFDEETGRVNAIIETAKGMRTKYKFDSETGLFRLRKVLPLGAVFPFDFGFIPATRGQDGDPLDVLVLMEEPGLCGCLVVVRMLGVIEAEQVEHGETSRNDRFIGVAENYGVPDHQAQFAHARELADLNEEMLNQIEHFYISYNRFEGKEFKILRRKGVSAAIRSIRAHTTAATEV